MKPRIIFEDEDLLVLDKPAGLIVNDSDTTVGEETVQRWAEEKLKTQSIRQAQGENSKLKTDSENDFYKRAGIVHRLDKETSGILLVAKNQASFLELQRQFKERTVRKTYIALTHGKIDVSAGEIKVPIGRLPWNRKRFGVIAEGKDATTKYKVLRILYHVDGKTREPLTLLELYPETGRTHQIRVHLKYFGHPIFSDPLYAGRKTARNDRKLLSRVFLHACKISFLHPKTSNRIEFESTLPPDLQGLLDSLQN